MVIMWRLVLLIPLGLSMPISRSRTIFSGESPRARSPRSSPASGPSPKSTGSHTPPCGTRWRCSASEGSSSPHTAGVPSSHRPSPEARPPAGHLGNNPAAAARALQIDPAEPTAHAVRRRDLRHSRQAQTSSHRTVLPRVGRRPTAWMTRSDGRSRPSLGWSDHSPQAAAADPIGVGQAAWQVRRWFGNQPVCVSQRSPEPGTIWPPEWPPGPVR